MLLRETTPSVKHPWRWRPTLEGWFERIDVPARTWEPHGALRLERELVSTRLQEALDQQCPWLYHPCANRLTLDPTSRVPLQRDLQLAVWIAANTKGELGRVNVPQDCTIWTLSGPKLITGATYTLRELADNPAPALLPGEPALDVWCNAIGDPEPDTWAEHPPSLDADGLRLGQEIERYYRTVAFLEMALPECHAWMCDVTKLTMPLRGDGATFRSGSHPGLPGVVQLDLLAEYQICEALVHESAHLYLFRDEMAGPLVDPGHVERYTSPLRPEPRPLRGILLAYHALAYISAFYRDTLDIPLISPWGESELADRQGQARAAEEILAAQLRHLEPAGQAFFELTRDVYAYSTR